MNSPTTPDDMSKLTETANALSMLVIESRQMMTRARRIRQVSILDALRSLAVQLDAARTQLVTLGPDALPSALAFEAAGRVNLQGIQGQLDRADLGIDRMAAERTEAADVIAWIEWHGIHLYPYQRRQIEAHLAA